MQAQKSKKLEDQRQKTQEILNNLDKPFNLMSVQLDRQKPRTQGFVWRGRPKEFEIAEKIENQLKSTFNLEKIKWLYIVKIFLFSLVALAFINMYARADFINMLIPVYILAMLSQSMADRMFENMTQFLIFTSLTLITDLLWLIFRDSVSS